MYKGLSEGENEWGWDEERKKEHDQECGRTDGGARQGNLILRGGMLVGLMEKGKKGKGRNNL